MIIPAIMFMLIGGSMGIIFITIGIAMPDPAFALFGALFALVFPFAGGSMLLKEIEARLNRQNVVNNGERVRATVIGYREGDGVIYNGQRPIDIAVKFYYNDAEMQEYVPTNQYKSSKYPLGGHVELSILGDQIQLINNVQ